MAIPLRVLILEDNLSDAEMMLHALRRAGYDPSADRVETEQDFRTRLSTTPEIILSDFSMPEFEGLRALEIMQEEKLDIPFIVVSGSIGDERAVQVMQRGATDYVLKDRMGRLGQAVAHCLEKKHLRDVALVAERRLLVQRAVTQALAESPTLAAAPANVLRAICESITWDSGTIWQPEPGENVLRCAEWWCAPGARVGDFEALSRQTTFAPGAGLPGGVWASGRPVWVADLAREPADPRAACAARVGLRTAFAVPITLGAATVGVLEFFRRDVRPRDDDKLKTMTAIGSQLALYIDSKRSEAALRKSEERYRTLISATAAMVWDSPPSGEFDSDQPGWTAFTGQTTDQHKGWGWLDVLHPDDREKSARAWSAAMKTRSVYEVEHRLRRADGVYREMSARAVPITEPDGTIREWVGVHTDVTDQKRAEEDLRHTTDLLRGVVEGTTDAVYVKDREGRYQLFNGAAARFVGRTVEEVLGKDDTALFDPAGARRVMAQCRSVMESGQVATTEEVLTAAGVTRTYHTTEAPHWDAAGNVIGVIGIARDISSQRRLAVERDELLARLQLQINRMPLAYILFDADFHITEWNPAAERIFGYSRAEALGMSGFDLVPPSFWQEGSELLARFRAGDLDAHSVNENLTKDGRTITCEWLNTPLIGPDGAFQGVLALAQDVTARREAELALRLRDRVIGAATQGFLITDPTQPDNPIAYASPGFERITGYTSEEALGRNCRFLQGPDTDPVAVALVREALRAGEPCTVELLNYRKNGTTFWNELSISPIRDAAGRLTHVLGLQADVTARRSLEEQFRQSQKMEAVGQLAAGIAHDFNNLLTIINGYSDLLLQNLPPGDQSRDSVTEILKAGERSAGLTRKLLAFSRQQVLTPVVLDLNAVVTDTEQMLRRLVGADIRLTTTLLPLLGAVRADAGQVELVLMNLVVNARDAMPAGGRLTIETRNVELDEGYVRTHQDARPGPHVLLSVTDTGCGIPPEVKARLFEPFFTTKEKGKGTGLGLATVYGIVKQSGGHIAVYSEVGVGTTFKVYLPQVPQAVAVAKGRSGVLVAPRGTETVLLVEDEDGVRALTRHVLAGCGYAVLEATDGEEAIRTAARHAGPIHLLLTDVIMPGLGGRAVAEEVVKQHPEVRVLFVSGYTDDAVIRHGVLAEGVNFLQKPFSPIVLAFKVREALDAPARPAFEVRPAPPRSVESRPRFDDDPWSDG